MVKFVKAKDAKHNVVAYARVPSESNKFIFYFVVKYKDGRVACNCGDYIFRRPKEGCKHIQQLVGKRKVHIK